MKKIISFVLVLMMLLTAAVAATPVSAASDPFQIGDDSYATLKAAWTAATEALASADSVTIRVLDDYTVTTNDFNLKLATGKAVALVGEKKADESYPTLTDLNGVSSGVKLIFSKVEGTLTLKNLNITASQLMEMWSNATVNVENVVGYIPAPTETAGGLSDGPFIKLWDNVLADATLDINIKNSQITSKAACGWIIGVGQDKKKTVSIDIEDSTLCAEGMIKTADRGVIATYSNNNILNVTLKNSQVLDKTTMEADTAKSWCVNVGRDKNSSIALTLDATSKLQSGSTASHGLISNKMTVTLTNGAQLVTGYETALPTSADKDGSRGLGFVSGSKIYKQGAVAPAGTYTFLGFHTDDFTMVKGASIRTADPAMGLRFRATVSEDFRAVLGDAAEFGMMIAPSDKIMAVNLFKKGTMVEENYFDISFDTMGEAKDGVISLCAAVIASGEVSYEKVNTKFAAKAYFSITYEGDEKATVFYTDFSFDNNQRSMYDVAKLVKASPTYSTNSAVEAIYAAGQPKA